MIKSIRLLNWRSHADTKLGFHKGTNLLVGIMGSGKSSILEAISFALFGTFPALERRKLKLENVIRLNEKDCRVEIEFGWDGGEYKVVRTLERSKRGITSNAEAFKNNALVEHGTKPVTSFVETLVSLDYDLFTRAIYSEQNNIDHFLNLDPRRRKQEIDTLLGLDKFELARANAVTVIGRVRSKKGALEERFNTTRLAELETKEKTHAQEAETAGAKLKEAQKAYEKQQAEAKELSSSFDSMRQEREAFVKLEKEIIVLSAQLNSLDKELKEGKLDEAAFNEEKKRLSSIDEERARHSALMKSLDNESSRLAKESGSVESSIRSRMEAQKRLSTMKKELFELLDRHTREELTEKQKELERSLLSMESERKSIEREAQELAELLSKLKPGISRCPLCSSNLTEDALSHIKEERETSIKQKKTRAEELAKLLDARRKDNADLVSSLQKASLLSEKIASFEAETKDLEKFQTRKKELKAELTISNEKRKTAQEALDSLAKQGELCRARIKEFEELIQKKRQFDAISKSLNTSREKLAGIKFDEKAFENLRAKAEQSRISSERALSQKQSLETQLRHSKEMLRLVQEELIQTRNMEKGIKELHTLEEQLSIYKNALLETQTSLRHGLTDSINSAMNEIWSIFYPYKNYRALRLTVTERDYIFEVDNGDGWKGLETIASGGERATAALTLRVALAMVLTPKLSWLILDEPTHNLDSEAVELLSSALQSKVPEVVKQTFVITHDEAFMGSDFASSYRLKRDKEHNGETIAEAM